MSVKQLHFLIIAATLTSGCSTLNQTQDGSWSDRSSWFGNFSLLDDIDSDKVSEEERVAAGEAAGRVDGSIDGAIDPQLQAAIMEARKRLDQSGRGSDTPAMAHDDLWQRLRSGFALDHSIDNKRVQEQLNWYVSHPSYIKRVVERGRRYLHYILTETEKRGLPTEFALLPVVESAFDPFAYSHGRAAGLWQFIPSTAKHFGLTQSWWHDDRRDVVEATNAALTYLKRLTKQFNGDYMLALAAYNSGEGTVFKAVERNRKKGRPGDFWSLNLPRETRHYVPKMIALAKIFDRPQDYGIKLPPLRNEPYFEIVDTGSQLDLAQAADLAGVDVNEIYLLNPTYNRWATNPDGPHRLLIPKENAKTFRAALAKFPTDKRVSWRNYKATSGDTLISIARKYSTTPSVIRQVNKLDSNMIRIGQSLMIPSATKDSEAYVLSASSRLEQKQDRKRSGNKIRYTVKRDDTFWDIARDHRVSVRELAAWNGMAPGDPLIPGKELVIWSKSSTPTTQASSSARNKAMVRKVGYRVRKGDSLSTIASRFSVNVHDIANWNGLNTTRYLQPGQSLVLYVDIRNSH